MSNIRFLIIVLLYIVSNVSAQEDVLTPKHLAITIAPLAFADGFSGCGYRLGVAFQLQKEYTVGIDVGSYFYQQPYEQMTHINGIQLRPMLRFRLPGIFTSGKKYRYESYIGVEYLYKKIGYDYMDSIKLANTPVYNQQYRIRRAINGIEVVYGETLLLTKWLAVEWYGGGGVRHINSSNNLTQEQTNGILHGEGHGDLIGGAQRNTSSYFAP